MLLGNQLALLTRNWDGQMISLLVFLQLMISTINRHGFKRFKLVVPIMLANR